MSRPLNEYPKEELEALESAIHLALKDHSGQISRRLLYRWLGELEDAIIDVNLADKELPFKTTEQKHGE